MAQVIRLAHQLTSLHMYSSEAIPITRLITDRSTWPIAGLGRHRIDPHRHNSAPAVPALPQSSDHRLRGIPP